MCGVVYRLSTWLECESCLIGGPSVFVGNLSNHWHKLSGCITLFIVSEHGRRKCAEHPSVLGDNGNFSLIFRMLLLSRMFKRTDDYPVWRRVHPGLGKLRRLQVPRFIISVAVLEMPRETILARGRREGLTWTRNLKSTELVKLILCQCFRIFVRSETPIGTILLV